MAAIHKGGRRAAEKARRVVPGAAPLEVPPLDWSTPEALLEWAASRAALVERGKLDRKNIPEELARLARGIHELQALEGLKAALLRLEQGGPTVALLAQIRSGDGLPRLLPWKKAIPAAASEPSEEGSA